MFLFLFDCSHAKLKDIAEMSAIFRSQKTNIKNYEQGTSARPVHSAQESGAAPRLFASGGKISYLYRSLRARRISVGAVT